MKYPKNLYNVVLIEPEIPQNTGNIGRTCVGCWSSLHLVGKLGFDLSDKQLKRAGLDYWPNLQIFHHSDLQAWSQSVPNAARVFYFSTKAKKSLYSLELQAGDWLVFGKETKGLDEQLLLDHPDQAVKIPFPGHIRSFNLANAVAMVLGEGLRQAGY